MRAFEGTSQIRTSTLTLYASPDLHFLTSDLLDTRIAPVVAERAKNEALMRGLSDAPAATRGPLGATVTIVEFSDFECPYCRKFAQTLDEALAGQEKDIRVVFHHFPLGGHAWARRAAEGAACAQLQNTEAFWALHDEVFRNQANLTAKNIDDKLSEFARNIKSVDIGAFGRCMTNSMSLGLVLKDMNLADANDVEGTPTVFINGRRLQGVENVAHLRQLIIEARTQVDPSSKGSNLKAQDDARSPSTLP